MSRSSTKIGVNLSDRLLLFNRVASILHHSGCHHFLPVFLVPLKVQGLERVHISNCNQKKHPIAKRSSQRRYCPSPFAILVQNKNTCFCKHFHVRPYKRIVIFLLIISFSCCVPF
eukprot:Lithocolla_globosa_v1_NODE_717_length_3393_cov_20.802454.p6 type:complete len:115 gc:universal NODE_717_length_3393_cov_20.802454:1425-1769(+)